VDIYEPHTIMVFNRLGITCKGKGDHKTNLTQLHNNISIIVFWDRYIRLIFITINNIVSIYVNIWDRFMLISLI
jgi:hypothetical protein